MTKEQSVELWKLHDEVTEAAKTLVAAQWRKDEASAKFHAFLESLAEPPAKRPYNRKAKAQEGQS
jgi:hypothetical protein